jgi:transitional endoplasmic reticulum ATPase
MPEPIPRSPLPAWAEDLRGRYLRGEASMFVLHGNVFDSVLHRGTMLSLGDFLTGPLLAETKETIVLYNLATGVRFRKRAPGVELADDLLARGPKEQTLGALEKLLAAGCRTAVVLEYAEQLAPAGDPAFQTDADRAALVTLHRWSFLPEIEKGDNVVILVTENLTDLAPKLIANPKVAVVEVPMPDRAARQAVVCLADPSLDEREAERYAEQTGGLKAIQIASILAPPPPAAAEGAERRAFIAALLGGGPAAEARADKLAVLTAGLGRDEIRGLLAPAGTAPAAVTTTPAAATATLAAAATAAAVPGDAGGAGDAQGAWSQAAPTEIDRLIAHRKREILARECYGLVELVAPAHGFEVVGGMDEVKSELALVARNMREGRLARVPMGILFTGPMGTGKTFVAEAFAKECGLAAIKLKNFRSKWVGATEGNLEKILSVVQAIGQVIVIIDEGDRAFGSGAGEDDGGTSSRVIARIKEFMSDTGNRGRILFLVMTNRPDKLDVDLKRAGRLDRKIPFLYSQTPEEVEAVAQAVVRKNKVKTDVDFAAIREGFSQRLVGWSNADVEAVVLLANDGAARAAGSDAPVEAKHFLAAADDYFPSRDAELLEYMELLAVFEASSRRLLPAKYASLTPDQLDAKLRLLRAVIGNRR